MLAGCAGLNGIPAVSGNKAEDLGAIVGRFPLPDNARLNVQQSIIVGSGERWIGQIRIEAPMDGTAAYSFFMKRLNEAGWSLRSGVLAKRSIMHFSGNDRVLSVEIESGQFGGSSITLTATPDGAQGRR